MQTLHPRFYRTINKRQAYWKRDPDSAKKRSGGFTLIEILVALTIFAILSTITASTMYYAFKARDRVAKKASQLMALELALTMMEKDFQQIVPRPLFKEDYQQVPAFIGQTDEVEFTRGGVSNPSSILNRSTLTHNAYICEQGMLIRRSWLMLDQPDKKQYRDKTLLEHLKNCQFSYLNSHLQVLDAWRANALPDIEKKVDLPQAIRFTLDVPGFGSGQFLFIVPGGA